jgi:hypothetical protein
MIPASIMIPIGLLLAGWGPEKHVHWIVADIVSPFVPLTTCLFNLFKTGCSVVRGWDDIDISVHDDICDRYVYITCCVW